MNVLHSDILRGHTDAIVLGLLRAGDRYGYDLYKEVLARSGGRYELKEPTLYSALRRLEAQGWVRSYWGEETQGGRRRYYAITGEGSAEHARLTEEWQRARELLDLLME